MPAASDLQHSPSSCQCTKDETGVQAGRHRSMQTLKFEIWDSLSTFSNVSRYNLKENTLALGVMHKLHNRGWGGSLQILVLHIVLHKGMGGSSQMNTVVHVTWGCSGK